MPTVSTVAPVLMDFALCERCHMRPCYCPQPRAHSNIPAGPMKPTAAVMREEMERHAETCHRRHAYVSVCTCMPTFWI